MLSRKRKLSLDEYIQSISAQHEKRQKTDQFYDNLRLFYRRKWGFPLKSPYINGNELNLYDLYDAVVNLGGWQKVTSFDRWNEVLQKLSIDENIQMAEHAVRFLYMQYLSKFEQNENGGDIVDEHENELLGGRSNRVKGINTMNCYYEPPFSMPKLITGSSSVPNFHKVIYSLLSGLPNDVAFGLNILTIMSHPGPFVINFINSPQLINILVEIIGISVNLKEQGSLSKLHDSWQKSTNYNMTEFWMKAGIEERQLYLSIYNPIGLETTQTIFELNDADKFDLNKPINWRVFNVLGIFYNLSFEEVNHQPMGENKALIRFLLICCNCRYQLLRKPAYEILSNVSKNINLISLDNSVFNNVLIKTIQNGLHSNDKSKVLRSMEIVAGLCQVPANETIICDFLDRGIARIFTLISLKDILICVVCLETLLQISELGKTLCEMIGSHNSAINLLVGMLTTDAASFGQIGLYGIKVVEVRGHHMQPYVNPNKKNVPSQSHPNPPPSHTHHQTLTAPQLHTAETSAELALPRQQYSSKTPQPISQHDYANDNMCEWMMALDGNEEIEPCSRFFQSASNLLYHIYNDHLKTLVKSHSSPKSPDDICMIRCRWPMCDNTPRTLWSMTTHLQDVHCTEYNLEANLRKRCDLGFDEYTNQIRHQYEKNRGCDQQPGYSPFAAYEAIRRHAFVNIKKEITDDSEGPVTKNLRLTAALILRNVCKNSVTGRRKLRRFESFLSWLSLSKMESSRTLAQCLAEIINHSSTEVGKQIQEEEEQEHHQD